MKRQIKLFFGMIILGIFLINIVSAVRLFSEIGVDYDSQILDLFENNSYVDVTITLNDSINRDNFITEFSNEEFKDIVNTHIPNKSSNRFSVKIPEDTFFKLLQDERVKIIDYNGPVHMFLDDLIGIPAPGYKSKIPKKILIGLSLMIILIIIILYLIRQKQKKK